VLDIREKELGPDHVDVAASLNNIAVLLKTSGQFEEAEEMYNRSIAIKEKALGPNHPQVPALPCCATLENLYRLLHALSFIGALVVVIM
jgi:tetratricopeptide (TPR) repeat protein